MAAISCDGEVGDGAEVAAGEALCGFAEGGVGLDAEGGVAVIRRRFITIVLVFITTVLLPMRLLSCRSRRRREVLALSSVVERCDGLYRRACARG